MLQNNNNKKRAREETVPATKQTAASDTPSSCISPLSHVAIKRDEMMDVVRRSLVEGDAMQLVVIFDGACRGNGTWGKKSDRTVKSSCGAIAYLIDTREPVGSNNAVKAMFCNMMNLSVETNNKAELLGMTEAVKLINFINVETGRTQFVAAGDSEYVIGSIRRGVLQNLTMTKSDQPNWEEWNKLRSITTQLNPNVTIDYKWIPRSVNRAADRICNDVIDGKSMDMEYVCANPPIMSSFTDLDYLSKVFAFATEARHPSCRVLAPILLVPWRTIFFNLLKRALENLSDVETWMAVLLMPKIILYPQSKKNQLSLISTNSSFNAYMKVFRMTIGGAHYDSAPIQYRSTLEERVVSLVAQNRVSRACDLLSESDVSIREPTLAKALQFWPRVENDTNAKFDDQQAETSYGELYAQLRRMPAGKSPDITGWTKELLMPIFNDASESERLMIQALFINIVNESLPKDVNKLLYSTDGLFLGNDTKERPVVNTSIWSKLLWRVAFHREDRHFPSVNSAAQAIFLQRIIDAGFSVVKLDGKNAFQCMRRSLVFDAISHIEDPLFRRMWNRSYARATPILLFKPSGKKAFEINAITGVLAGCVSASKLFQAALTRKCSIPQMISYVDDVHFVIPRAMNVESAMQILHDALDKTGVNFFGQKTKIIVPGRDIAAFESLGAVIKVANDKTAVNAIFKKKLEPTYERIRKLVALKVPLQVKLFMLRTLELRCRYSVEASIIPEGRDFAETSDVTIVTAIGELFDLFEVPQVHRALITLPMGEGGLGLCQNQARIDWARSKNYLDFAAMWKTAPQWMRDQDGLMQIDPPNGNLEPKADIAIAKHVYALYDIDDSLPAQMVLSCACQHYCPQRHLLLEVPAAPFRLSDDAMRALVWTKLAYIPTKMVQVPCQIAAGDTLFNHIMTCKQCQQVTVRHNAIVYELARLLPKIGYITKANPNWLPHPDNALRNEEELERTVTGPDLVIFSRPTMCIDVCITGAHRGAERRTDGGPMKYYMRDAMTQWESRKDRKYEKWHQHYRQTDPDITCYPFVMTASGLFGKRAIAYLKLLAKDRPEARWFPSYAQLRMQKELAEILAVIFRSTTGQRLGVQRLLSSGNADAASTTLTSTHTSTTTATSVQSPIPSLISQLPPSV